MRHDAPPRRSRRLTAGLAVLLVVTLVAAGLAVVEQRRADDHAGRADAVALAAQVSDISTLARTLPASQVDLALLLGVESHRLQPAVETEGALETALARTPPGLERAFASTRRPFPRGRSRRRHGGRARADGSVRLLSLPSLEEVRVLRGRDEPAAIARFSNDGARVVVGGVGGSVHVWDVASGRLDGEPLSTAGQIRVRILRSGRRDADVHRAADGGKGSVVQWDRRDRAHPLPVGQPFRFGCANGDTGCCDQQRRFGPRRGRLGLRVDDDFDVRTRTPAARDPGHTRRVCTRHTHARHRRIRADRAPGRGDGTAGRRAADRIRHLGDRRCLLFRRTRLAALDGDRGIRVFEVHAQPGRDAARARHRRHPHRFPRGRQGAHRRWRRHRHLAGGRHGSAVRGRATRRIRAANLSRSAARSLPAPKM